MYLKEGFPEDLDAYGIAIKEKDFKWANIFANRIMSNSYLFDQKETGIIGHVLKEIASDGINLQQKKDPKQLSDYSQKSRHVVGGIITMLEKNQIDCDEVWQLYNNHQKATNKMFQSEIEQTAYPKTNEVFSISIIDKLIELLEKHSDILLEPQNNLFKGILNEAGRISKVYGLSKEEEHFVSLLRGITRIDDYIKAISKGSSFVAKSEEQIIPLVKKIIELNHNRKENNYEKDDIDNLLWEMIKIWRFYFIKYMEVPLTSYSFREEKIHSEDEEESKLVEEVKKHIEKEMGV